LNVVFNKKNNVNIQNKFNQFVGPFLNPLLSASYIMYTYHLLHDLHLWLKNDQNMFGGLFICLSLLLNIAYT